MVQPQEALQASGSTLSIAKSFNETPRVLAVRGNTSAHHHALSSHRLYVKSGRQPYVGVFGDVLQGTAVCYSHLHQCGISIVVCMRSYR